jgi:hypothetical protein
MLNGIILKSLDWINLAQNMEKWQAVCKHSDKTSGYTECGEI